MYKHIKPFFPLLVLVAVLVGVYWYRTPAHAQGEQAPDFTGYLPNGDSMRLSDLRGKVVLLDFWGSWCGPCRQANPHLVQLHQKYAATGLFEMVSVGIESKQQAWLNAIKNDKLLWKYHISDLKQFKDHVALLYGVRVIPTTILIDKQGVILGVKLSAAELDKKIQAAIGG